MDLQICKNLEGEGGYLDRRELHNGFDSNAITPGTEFMRRVAERLRIFICTQLLTQPAWQHLQVGLVHRVLALAMRLEAQSNTLAAMAALNLKMVFLIHSDRECFCTGRLNPCPLGFITRS